MKKCRILCLILSLCFLLPLFAHADPAKDDFLTPPPELKEFNYPSDFTVDAPAYALVELKSNSIIFSKELDMKRFPASLTKIMTCMLAIEYGKPTDILTVSASALQNLHASGSTAGLVEGEEMSLDDMLYCVMLWSANEGCNVIGEHVSGSVEAFVELMNQTAQALGMENTHFANTHGLHDENHYTTVRDMLTLSRWAWNNETFRKYAVATSYDVPATNKSDVRSLHTTNHLVSTDVDGRYFYSYARGIKTGYTTPAGGCLVSTATDGDAEYLSIVMGCDLMSNDQDMRFIETKRMFRHAFETYSFMQILTDSTMLDQPTVKNAVGRGDVVVHAADNVTVLLPKTCTPEDITVRLSYDGDLVAPVSKGQKVGTVTVLYQGLELAESDLLALTDVAAPVVVDPTAPTQATQSPVTQEKEGGFRMSYILWPLGILFAVVFAAFVVMQIVNARRARRRAMERRMRQERRTRYYQTEPVSLSELIEQSEETPNETSDDLH